MPRDIKVAFAGVHRASSFFKAFQVNPETQIVALCDLSERTLGLAAEELGVKQLYTGYERMLDEAKPDAVVVATPMQLHPSQSIAALERGISVLSEVTAAVFMDEARWLTQAAKRSKGVYMMAENYTYIKQNVLVKAMVEAGAFGEVYYAEGEYLHNCTPLYTDDHGRPTWRGFYAVGTNGHVYPTHSLGPCYQWFGGERPVRISCIGSGRWSKRENNPEYAMEDSILLLCKTASEKLTRIRFDILSNRPHAMANYTLQGTKGVYESARRHGEGHWVWLEGYSKDSEEWLPLDQFEAEFMPEMWRNPPKEALEAGHGGGDYFEVMDFVEAVKGRRPAPVGIHQAMDMTLPGIVSRESIARGGEWLPVPDSRAW